VLLLICIVFVIGYLAIALEHPLKVNKAASALATGVVCWTLYLLFSDHLVQASSIPDWFNLSLPAALDGKQLVKAYLVEGRLLPMLGEIAGLLFFLLAAMIIVELVDAYEGFSLITDRISATSSRRLAWLTCWLTFFLSSVLDNLTTTIVMISLLRKLIADRKTRQLFCGLIVIAANAGGAWSVIGDVTTTMLWMKSKISAMQVMQSLFLPSAICLLVPLIIISSVLRGAINRPVVTEENTAKNIDTRHSKIMLALGLIGLLSVPIHKNLTHLPPMMGILLSLSIVWIVSEMLNSKMDEHSRSSTHVLEILKRIDSSSILFFLGILLAVGCLSTSGLLRSAAEGLDSWIGEQTLIAVLIGLVSAVVDNVPLVAAGIEMYSNYPINHTFWNLLAYCTGTGGSCLIIGSAAGVAAMGLERIDFLWYLRCIAPLALAGYLSGVGVYWLNQYLLG
jgi:Na+/H+ antiporter NhaD/arsenite permease-like protein